MTQFGALLGTALGQPPAQLPRGQGSDRFTVPFEYTTGRAALLVRARINRRPAALILDTGSTHTIVTAAFLGVPERAIAPARPGAGVLGDATGAEIDLEFGTRVWRRRVAVMDLSRVLSNYQERIDGLLGLDFFLQFSQVALNLEDRAVTLIR